MAEITIYTKDYCPYCHSAKQLLTQKGASFTEVDVLKEPARLAEMVEKAGGRRTVPQIFINGKHIGGCDDLYDLDAAKGLDPLLGA